MANSKESSQKKPPGSPKKPVIGPQKLGDPKGFLLKKKPGVDEGEDEEKPVVKKPVKGEITEDLDVALNAANEALALDPQNEELHMQKYHILKQMGDKDLLVSALEEAAKCFENPFFPAKLAELWEERFKYEPALEWRKRVVELKGDDPYSWKRLAIAHVRTFAFEEAEHVYDKLLELQPDAEDPLGHTFFQEMQGVGVSKERRLEVQKLGIRVAKKALQKNPDSIPLLEGTARLARHAKDTETSIILYQKLLSLETAEDHPNYRQWKTEVLRIYAREGLEEDWKNLNKDLIEDYKGFLENNPYDSNSWLQLGLQQIQAGLFEDAIVSLKKAISNDEKNVQALYELGRILVRLDRSKEAIEFYLNIVPGDEELGSRMKYHRALELCLGDLYYRLGMYEEALNIYRREERANSRYIGIVLEAMGKDEQAFSYYNQAIEVSPRDGRNYQAITEYYVRKNMWAEAVDEASKGLECPHITREAIEGLYVSLATAKMKTGEFNEALKIMEDATDASPELLSMDLRRVKLMFLQKKFKEAKQLGEEIIKKIEDQVRCAPSASDLWSTLGDCYSLLGRLDKATEAYTQAMKFNAMDSEAVRGMGVLAEKDGDFDQAIQLFSKFTMLEPLNLSTPPLKAKIEELRKKTKVQQS